jgi:N12 class adenine-specific DNA methylase/GGDEF domain-containing protein
MPTKLDFDPHRDTTTGNAGGLDFDPFKDAAAPATTRTWGETAKDTGLAVAKGATNLVGSALALGDASPPFRIARTLVETATNQPGIRAAEAVAPVAQAIDAEKSEILRTKERELAQTEGFVPTVKRVLTDPALLGSFAAEQVPMVATLGAGTASTAARAGQAAATRALAGGAAPAAVREASATAGNQAAQRFVVGSNAALEAGPAGEQAYQQALALPQEVWDANPDYQAMVAQGVSPELAKARIAQQGAEISTGLGAVAGAVGGRVAAPFEASLFTRALPTGGPGALAANTAVGVAREAGEEAVQEGGGQLASNLGVQQVDPNQDPFEGVPESAGVGAAIGGVVGGGMGAGGSLFSRGERAAAPPALVDPVTGATSPMPDPANGPMSRVVTQAAAAGVVPTTANPPPPAPTPEQQQAEALTSQAQTLRQEAQTALPTALTDQRALLEKAVQLAANPEAKAVAQDSLDLFDERWEKERTTAQTNEAKAADLEQAAARTVPAGIDPATGELLPLDEAAVRAAITNGFDQGQPVSPKALLAAFPALTPVRAKELRQEVSAARRAAATGSPSTPAPAAAAAAPEQSTPPAEAPAAVQTPTAVDSPLAVATEEGTSALADEAAPAPVNAAETESPFDESTDVLDDDITAPSGPFTIADAAERAAKREGGGARVFAVDGGFVVRKPRAGAVHAAAAEAATSPTNDRPEPTEAQKDAGNYKKGHVRVAGLDVSIENPAGTKRRPEWAPLQDHYGYLKRTEGADGDHVDVFLGPQAEDAARPVFIVDQVNKDGSFDEHKVVLGAIDETEARALYLRNYEAGWSGLGAIRGLTQDEFKAWLRDPEATKRPAALPTTTEGATDVRADRGATGPGGRAGVVDDRRVGAAAPAAPGADVTAPAAAADAAPTPAAAGPVANRAAALERILTAEAAPTDTDRKALGLPRRMHKRDAARLLRDLGITTSLTHAEDIVTRLGPPPGEKQMQRDPLAILAEARRLHAARAQRAIPPAAAAIAASPQETTDEGQDETGPEVPAGQQTDEARQPAQVVAAAPAAETPAGTPDRRTDAAARAATEALPADARDAEIARLRAQLAETQRQLDTDPLTGVASRSAYERDKAAARGVAVIDLKLFKGYNTVGGQTGGDVVLRAFGAAMRDAEAEGVRAYRSGGDEFTFLATSPEAVQAAADRLLDAAAQIRLTLDHDGVTYEVSGVPFTAGFGTDEKSADQDLSGRKGEYDRNALPDSLRRRDADPAQQGDAPAAEGRDADQRDVQGQAAPDELTTPVAEATETPADAGVSASGDAALRERIQQVIDALPANVPVATGARMGLRGVLDAMAKGNPASLNLPALVGNESNRLLRRFPSLAEVLDEIADQLAAPIVATPSAEADTDLATEEVSDDSSRQSTPSPVDFALAAGVEPSAIRAAEPVRGSRAAGHADDRGVSRRRGRAAQRRDEQPDLGLGVEPAGVPDAAPGAVAGGRADASARDFHPALGGLTREGSWFETAKRNLDLIDLARKIESEGRAATAEEQAQLSKYVGFGASEIRNNLFPVPQPWVKAQRPNDLIFPEAVREPRWKPLAERAAALPRDWQQSILQSTQYAHYTSENIVRGIWSAVERLGFPGGKVLEPGAGIGSFAMLMPDALRRSKGYTGIEFDGPTALIARLLSPQQNLLHDDFIKRRLPREFFDLAIGNPPFSQTQILADPEYAKHRFMLHDFFFAKSIDRVRPGGLLVFVTSKGTMDKQSDKARAYLAARADLLGAIRLPSVAFEANAGTSVVTDVLFLRKRAKDEAPAGYGWQGVATVETKDGPVVINEYFAAHPAMVLGENRISGNRDEQGRRINANGYGGDAYTVVSYDSSPAELDAKFDAAVQQLPRNAYSALSGPAAEVRQGTGKVDFDPKIRREGVIYRGDDGTLMRVSGGIGKPLGDLVKLTEKDARWFAAYVGLREQVQAARAAQFEDGDWEAALAKLNTVYDAFREEFGPVNDFRVQVRKGTDEDGNPTETPIRIFKNRRLLIEDYDSTIVASLEQIGEDGEIRKSPFLQGRTIGRPTTREVKTIGDALAVSLDEIGRLDLDDVARRLSITRQDAIEALGDQVFDVPGAGHQLADEYLSGDVVTKLEEARTAAETDRTYRRNVDALVAVQPEKLGPSQIGVKLGASWVPAEYVNEFATEIGAGAVTFDALTESWEVKGGNKRSERRAGLDYGTADRSPSELLEAALNSRPVTVKGVVVDPDGKKREVTDPESTTAANETIRKIKERFKAWVWTDSDRAAALVETYNRRFNNLAPRRFDGSHLTLPGVSLRFKLHPHQLRAIWRQVATGNTYLAHAVGAGKTIEMIAGGMEQKRLGLIRKPTYVVPNHMLEQFANEFMELYPLANIMVADDENFTGERRRAFVAAATLNAPDAIIITHSAFERIGVKEESVAPIRDELLAELESELDDAKEDRVRRSQLQQQIEAVTQRFERIVGAGAKDSTIRFEEMGVDMVYVDEFHAFRKLDFTTNQRLKGIDPNGSKRALDMYVKTRILERARPGRSLVAASGTPVTNTMGELYTILRFFAGDMLHREGIATFDGWSRQFGEAVSALEANAAGRYEMVERFARFDNVPELMSRVRQFMDVLTSEQLGALVKRPDLEGGKPNLVTVEPTDALKGYMKQVLVPRLEKSRRWKPSQNEPYNPDPVIAITSDGRFAALDPRFFGGKVDASTPTKLTQMAAAIASEYHATKANTYTDKAGRPELNKGSTQIVFYNLGFGAQSSANRGFNARGALNKALTDAGVKREHIAWFDDADTDAKKEATFKAMRSGQLRVLIGSAKKMGTGVNVQKRLSMLHYFDPPWYPSDVEQPHGRIIRQGNQNSQVRINWYATKGTYDSTMWQMVARKQRFIDQAFTGDRAVRSMDDLSEASMFEQAAAVASGDPRALQLAGLRQDVERLERLQAAHANEQIRAREQRNSAMWELDSHRERAKKLGAAQAKIGGWFAFQHGTIGGRRFEKMGDFGEAVQRAFNTAAAKHALNPNGKPIDLGELNGLPVRMLVEEAIKGKPTGKFELVVMAGDLPVEIATTAQFGEDSDAVGLARRMVNQVNGVDARLREANARITALETDLTRLGKKIGAPFEYQQDMLEKYADLKRLEDELRAEGEADAAAAKAAQDAVVIRPDGSVESRPEPAAGRGVSFSIGVGRSDLARAIAGAMRNWTGDVPAVRVVQDANALPAAARRDDNWGRIEGWYDGQRTVYVVASNVGNLKRGLQVLAHEAIGHYGVEGVIGKQAWAKVIADVGRLRQSANIAPALRAVLDAVGRRYAGADPVTLARETLAIMAERGVRASILDRVLAAVRRWLRAVGIHWDAAPLAEADLRSIVSAGMRRVTEGARAGDALDAMGAPAASVADVDSPAPVTRATQKRLRNEGVQPTMFFDALTAMSRGWRVFAGHELDEGGAIIEIRHPGHLAGYTDDQILMLQPDASEGGAASKADTAADTGPVADGFFDRLRGMLKPEGVSALEAAKAKLTDWTPAALGALTLRHLADVGGRVLPQLRGYIDTVTRMQTDRNVLQEEANAEAQTWEKWQRKHREESRELGDLMHDATIAAVDPAEAYQPLTFRTMGGEEIVVTPKAVRDLEKMLRDKMRGRAGDLKGPMLAAIKELRAKVNAERARRRAYPMLLARWNKLSPEGKAIYTRTRDAYLERDKKWTSALLERITALDLSAEKKRALTARLREKFESDRLTGPYFPLQRFGAYWIAATSPDAVKAKPDDPKPDFFMFESRAEQLAALRDLQAQGYTNVKSGAKLEGAKDVLGVSSGFMTDLMETLKGAPDDVQDDVWQLYLRALPELSQRKHFIHRKKVKGYNPDALRAFAANMNHGAYQIARLRHGHKLQSYLVDMQKQAKALAETGEGVVAGHLYNEASRRHEWVMNPQDSALVNNISGLGFAWYLGLTPGAALVNLTQTAIVAFPVLAARFGNVKAMNTLSKAMADATATYGNIETRLNDEERHAFRALRASGAIDKTQAHNLAGLSESDTRAYSGTWHRVMTGISHLFHKAEVINREATGIAAFRLARQSGMGFDAAVQYANDAIWESHFDYSNANRARFMQSGAAKVLLMFRQYSLNMTYFLWRNFYQTFRGESPEVRATARRKLVGVLGMTGLFSGALGLPLASVGFGVANAVADALGDDDDPPFDAKAEFRNFLADHLGAGAAEALTRGPVNALTGADIASRVSLDNLWLREPERELEGRALADYWLEQASGPIGGIFVNATRGLQLAQDGDVYRGIEAAVPKAIKDGLRAARFATEGVTTGRGDTLVEDFSPFETVLQLAGLTPARVGERYDANNAVKRYEDALLRRRASLLDAYAMAIRFGDVEGLRETAQRIIAFNAKNPELGINRQTIRRSLESRARFSARAQGGIGVNPRIEARARAMGRFAEDAGAAP